MKKSFEICWTTVNEYSVSIEAETKEEALKKFWNNEYKESEVAQTGYDDIDIIATVEIK